MLPSNWKDFLILHPWATVALLKDLYGIQGYDVTNWTKANVGAKQFWDSERPKWILSRLDDPALIKRSLKDQFAFYLQHEQSLALDGADAIGLLKKQKQPRKPWGRLIQSKYLEKLPEYQAHVDAGYTQISFLVCKIYPGPEWCAEKGLSPDHFPNKKKALFQFNDVVQMITDVYMSKLTEVDDIQSAMRIFLIRRTENEFAPQSEFVRHGVSQSMFSQFSKKALFDEVAVRFERHLGLSEFADSQHQNWSASKFRKSSDRKLDRCEYCERQPVDLHHLIERRTDPSLMYHEDNVVALCTQAHSLISRNLIGEDLHGLYVKARIDWRKAPDGAKTACFDTVMQKIHEKAYDTE